MKNTNGNIYDRITEELKNRKDRSAWNKGVTKYALELVDNLREAADYYKRDPWTKEERDKWLLNGAEDWNEYSENGSALIYDEDIAVRLCCPSELKRVRNGERKPNSRETWINVQARALRRASLRVRHLHNSIKNNLEIDHYHDNDTLATA